MGVSSTGTDPAPHAPQSALIFRGEKHKSSVTMLICELLEVANLIT